MIKDLPPIFYKKQVGYRGRYKSGTGDPPFIQVHGEWILPWHPDQHPSLFCWISTTGNPDQQYRTLGRKNNSYAFSVSKSCNKLDND